MLRVEPGSSTGPIGISSRWTDGVRSDRAERPSVKGIGAEMNPNSRGFFWPAGETTPTGRFAPPSAVPGHLHVLDDGSSRLILDAPLPTPDSAALSRLFSHGLVKGSIAGVLAGSDERVHLSRLLDVGKSRRLHGPSQESYVADRCLVSPPGVEIGTNKRFRWLELDLEGYSDWVGRPGIEASRGRRLIEARYRKSRAQRWSMAGRPLELERLLTGRFDDRMAEVAWRERNVLRVGGGAATMGIEEAINTSIKIEDLLALLADCDRRLDFPVVRSGRRAPAIRIYYSRSPRGEQEAEWHKAWARLGWIGESFGRILETWLERYDAIGPGFYLYLGNRRGLKMYREHRFASLVWGLEALHRNLHPALPNPKLEKKVERILGQLTERDRRWAAQHLPTTDEPSLATRIATLVRALPLGINTREADAFGRRCAQRRNDMSHYGGPRGTASHDEFLKEITELSSALDLLYHALLLQQATVPDEIIRARFDGGLHAPAAAAVLADCGLTVAQESKDGSEQAV